MLIIGIDGGGTKTEMVLGDEFGRELNHSFSGPSAMTGVDVGAVEENLRQGLDKLLYNYGGRNAEIEAAFAGLSGGITGNNSETGRDILMRLLPCCKKADVSTDAVNVIRYAAPKGDAMAAICGTGSSVFALVSGSLHRCGGWGYLLGDEGSGFDIGRRGLTAALRMTDHRGGDTCLTAMFAESLGKPVCEAIPQIYSSGKTFIASFAPLVLEAAEKGDIVAHNAVLCAASGMAEMIQTAGKLLDENIKTVAIAGSVWKNSYYRSMVENLLGSGYLLHQSEKPPVYGAYYAAMDILRLYPTNEIVP